MKKFVSLFLLLALAVAIVKILRDEGQDVSSRVAAVKDRARTTASERVKDPRAGLTSSVDEAIAGAAGEMRGVSGASREGDTA